MSLTSCHNSLFSFFSLLSPLARPRLHFVLANGDGDDDEKISPSLPPSSVGCYVFEGQLSGTEKVAGGPELTNILSFQMYNVPACDCYRPLG